MNCQEVAKHWQDFLDGNCSADIEKQMETHIQSCHECGEKLSMAVEKQNSSIPKGQKAEHPEIHVKKQQRILKKARWKQRFSIGGFWIGLFVLFLLVGTFLSNLYFMAGKNTKLDRVNEVLTTMTEMTVPNMSTGGRGSHTTPYFTANMETELDRRVGGEYKTIGSLQAHLFFSLLNIERKWDNSGGLDVKLHFLNPHHASNGEDDEKWLKESWEQLEKVKDGTVAEVAITLDQLYPIEEAKKLFATKDLEVVWFAVDTGPFERNDSYIGQFDALWGLPMIPRSDVLSGVWYGEPKNFERKVEKKGLFGMVVSESTSYEIPKPSRDMFLNGIRFLQETQRWANAYPHHLFGIKLDKELERVEAYVEEHGVHVYGVVITGPTAEILTLSEDKKVKYMSVGEIDWWNWGDTPYMGAVN